MEYKIENGFIVIHGRIRTKRIDVRKVTRIVNVGTKIVFYNDDVKLFSHRFSKELIDLSDTLFNEYFCKEVEYSDPGFQYWRKILNEQFEEEVEMKRKILDNELQGFKGKFDFDLFGEIIINSEKRGACFKVWGEKDGKDVLLCKGKKSMQLCIFIHIIAPLKINKSGDNNILAVFDECDMSLKRNMNNVIKYIEQMGWKVMIRQNGEACNEK